MVRNKMKDIIRLVLVFFFASCIPGKGEDVPIQGWIILSDNMDNALKYINILRRNCAIEGKEKEMEISASDLSVDFILDERARELCGEGKRWYDLKRLGKLIERTDLYNKKAHGNMKSFHELRPIPQSQIDRCTNVYPQNPQW